RDGHVTGVQTCALPISAHLHDLARPEVEAVGLCAAGGRAVQNLALAGLERQMERLHDALRHLGLDVEQILERAVEAVGPQRVAEIGRASCRERGWSRDV